MVKDGRLVFARGCGVADREAGIPVAPDALFRIVVRAGRDVARAAFFDANDTNGPGFQGAFDAALWDAHNRVTARPEGDLFGSFA